MPASETSAQSEQMQPPYTQVVTVQYFYEAVGPTTTLVKTVATTEYKPARIKTVEIPT